MNVAKELLRWIDGKINEFASMPDKDQYALWLETRECEIGQLKLAETELASTIVGYNEFVEQTGKAKFQDFYSSAKEKIYSGPTSKQRVLADEKRANATTAARVQRCLEKILSPDYTVPPEEPAEICFHLHVLRFFIESSNRKSAPLPWILERQISYKVGLLVGFAMLATASIRLSAPEIKRLNSSRKSLKKSTIQRRERVGQIFSETMWKKKIIGKKKTNLKSLSNEVNEEFKRRGWGNGPSEVTLGHDLDALGFERSPKHTI